ncbi:hypothetical protein Ancab_025454 [Ancistrocladus abbreviatus]
MMTTDLGMGMILHSSPYVPISLATGTMVGLNMSSVVALGIGPFGPPDLPKEMASDANLANTIIETNREFDVEGFLTAKAPHQVDETIENELMSNDTMIQNLKRLDVKNSSSEGHSISSVEAKRRKVVDDVKPISKKKKTQTKSSYSEF